MLDFLLDDESLFLLADDAPFILVSEVTAYGLGLAVEIGGQAVTPRKNSLEIERSLADGSTFACRILGLRSELSHVTRLALVTVTDKASGTIIFSGNIRKLSTKTVSVGAFDQTIEIDVIADGIEQQLYRRILTSAQAQQINRTATAAGQLFALARFAGDAYSAGDIGDDVPRLVSALGGDTVGALLRHLGDIQVVNPDGEISAFTRASLTATATADTVHVRRTSSYSGDLATTAQRVIAQGADTRFVRIATMTSDGLVLSAVLEADENHTITDVTKVVALGTIYGSITAGEELPVTWNTSRQSITLGLEIEEGASLPVQVHGVWRLEIVREREGRQDALSGDQIINIPSSIEEDITAVAERELARQQFPVETLALDMILGSGLSRLDIGNAVQVDIDLLYELDVHSPSADDLWLVDRLRITQPSASQASWSAWLARREPDFRTREFWSRERSRTQADQNIVSATNYVPAPEIAEAIPLQRITTSINGVVDLNDYFRVQEGAVLTYSAEVDNTGTVTALIDDNGVMVLNGVALGNTIVTVTATNGARTAVQIVSVHVVASLTPRIRRQLPDIQLERNSFQDYALASYFFDPDGDSLTYAVSYQTTTSGSASLSGASTLHVLPGSLGLITVTVTATDPSGLSVRQSFACTVVEIGVGEITADPNEAPVGTTIPAQTVEVGLVETVNLEDYFSDPDNDDLIFSVSSSDSAKVVASVAGVHATLRGVAEGSADVTATANDGNLSANQVFAVTVGTAGALNNAPRITRSIPAVVGQANLSQRVSNLGEYFSDPDDDSLTFSVISSNGGVVRAAISGGVHLDLTGRGAGNATVTVTATDPGGLTASQRVSVSLAQTTISNRAPVVSQSIADQAVTVATTKRITLGNYFSDPDNNDLSYAASSSATGRATVTVANGVLSVRGVSVGSATITVTASDGSLTVQQRFGVTINAVAQANRAPRVIRTAPDRTLRPGSSFTLGLGRYFSDPDDDDLTFSAISDDTDAVTAGVSGSNLTVRAIAVGSADVTVTANDGNLTVQQVISVTVQANRAPVVSRGIGSQSLSLNQSRSIDLSEHFSDPDDDSLSYAAASSATGRATVSVTGSTLTVTAVSAGSATITVTASDGDLSKQTTFSAVVQSNVVITTDTDTIWRRATSLPGTPSGGTSNRTHTPSGWSRTELAATGTQNVYRSRRTRTYRDGTFSSASAWGAPVKIADAVPVVTTDTDSIYRRRATAPGTPSGGTGAENNLPSGWSRTNPGATNTLNVYRSQRVRTYTNGSFTSASAWGAPTLFESATPTITTDTDSIYRRGTTAPSTPSGGTNDDDHLPTGWSRTEPSPTGTQNVYRSRRTRTYSNSSFTSASAWGAPVKIADKVTVTTTDTDRIYRRASSTPSKPTGGTSNETHLPTGWSRTRPGATVGNAVYRTERVRTYTNGSFTSATAWGNVAVEEAALVPANKAPILIRQISNITMYTGLREVFGQTLDRYFSDPDGDDLEYTATRSNTRVSVVVSSGKLEITPGNSTGTVDVTVRASDGLAHVEDTFRVTVVAKPAAPAAAEGVRLTATNQGGTITLQASCQAVPGATEYIWFFERQSSSDWAIGASDSTRTPSGRDTAVRSSSSFTAAGENWRVRVRAYRGNRDQVPGVAWSYSNTVTVR